MARLDQDSAFDRVAIARASKLLAKAGSTDSTDEALALALRTYSLLAETINRFEQATGAPRRRERRLVRDRRGGLRAGVDCSSSASASGGVGRAYGRFTEPSTAKPEVELSL